jgi:23S rRNA (guanine745-N1)-methyltransferase
MPQLLCTVRACRQTLSRESSRVVCPRGHSFDIAKSGYINLLQPQDRRAAVPGDSAEAVAARRRFLDRGYAAPLLDEIGRFVKGDVLDAGCGEGYYLANCHSEPRRRRGIRSDESLDSSRSSALGMTEAPALGLPEAPALGLTEAPALGVTAQRCGVDISVAAIELAAKRYTECEWIVANADRFIPYADGSFDTVMSITGRMNPAEFERVLEPGGRLVVAVAAPDDLIELRGKENRDRLERTIDTFRAFRIEETRRVTTEVEIDEASARDILTATYRPFDRVKPVCKLTLSLDVMVASRL